MPSRRDYERLGSLRNGWTSGVVADFVEVNPREPALPAEAPFVPMDSVTPGVRWARATQQREGRGGARFRGGDILFARITPCLENGKVAQWPLEGGQAGGSTEFIVMRASARIAPAFLYYWATSAAVRDAAVALMAGSTGRQRLSPNDLKEMPILLPPIEDQHRIADLMGALERAAASRSAEAQASWLLLQQAVDRLLSNPDWPSARLEKVSAVGGGITKGRKKAATREVPYLRVANVQHGRLDLSEIKIIEATEAEIERHALMLDDVLLLEGGNREDVGRGWIWSDEMEGCLHQNHLHRARANREIVDPRFLAYSICRSEARAYCLANAKQTSNLATINRTQISGLPIRVPSRAEQAKAVATLDAIRSVWEQSEAALREIQSVRHALSSTLLSGAHPIPASYDRFLSEIADRDGDAPATLGE